jgi:hypothetical protein
MTESADNLLRARSALAISGVAVADFIQINTETGKALASGELPSAFARGLDAFGDSPLLVRSEVAGALICPNRDTEETIAAIRKLLRNSAKEAPLLVMRLPGARHGDLFFPHLSGEATSTNPYAWNEYMDPRVGFARFVFGLGTRLDDRSGDDFSRAVALKAPLRRPETDFEEVCRYSQRKMDYINLKSGRVESDYFVDIMKRATDVPLHLFTTEGGSPHPATGLQPTALTFDPVLKNTDFVPVLRTSLAALETSFGQPVRIRFSTEFAPDRKIMITLTDCSPLPDPPAVEIDPKHQFVEARGAVTGSSRLVSLDHIVCVVPEEYGALPLRSRYEVARLIGKITNALDGRILLLGPGRWGTSSPELGIPAAFAEVSRACAIGEIVAMHKTLTPEVSMGAHILNELIAMDTLYFAIFPGREGNVVNGELLSKMPNRLSKLAPEASSWDTMIKVLDVEAMLRADTLKQVVAGWITTPNDGKID